MHPTLKTLQTTKGLHRQTGEIAADHFIRYDFQKQFIWEGENLVGLNLCNCDLTDAEWQGLLEAFDYAFPHLTSLNLSENNLTDIVLPALPQLEYLNLSENPSLSSLEFQQACEHLKHINLRACKLSTFYLKYGFEALTELDLSKNALTSVSLQGDCPILKSLDLSENQLTSFELKGPFIALEFLYLNDNSLSELKSASALPALKTLHLRNNQLQNLPEKLIKGKDFLTLYLHGNPLETINREFIHEDERGNSFELIRDLFKASEIKGTLVNTRVKIIIVGNGRVGKTSLLKCLRGEDFDEDEPVTHGIELGTLLKEHLPGVNTHELNASVWDFGGQEIFYATHQFFLSEEAIYLLAWTCEENVKEHRDKVQAQYTDMADPWREPTYWLYNIHLKAPDSPCIMVHTHADKKRLDPPSIHNQKPYYAKNFIFSAPGSMGLDLIKDQLTRRLNEGGLLGRNFPVVFEKGIQEIEKAKNQAGGPKVLSRKEFNALCASVDIPEDLTEGFLTYLHNTGIVVFFSRSPEAGRRLQDRIYIDPDWLTQEVYKLINPKLASCKGKFNRAYLKEALEKDGLETYGPEELEVFLELLKAFDLIFQAQEDMFISPQYLPEKPEHEELLFHYEMALKRLNRAFLFRFPLFVPDNLMVNFLSRFGDAAIGQGFYRHGIRFYGKKQEECLVEFHPLSRTLTVFTSYDEKSREIEQKVLANFVELSGNANAEISRDGRDFVSWQGLLHALKSQSEKVIVVKEEKEEEEERWIDVAEFAHLLGGREAMLGQFSEKLLRKETKPREQDPGDTWTDWHSRLLDLSSKFFPEKDQRQMICDIANLKRKDSIPFDKANRSSWWYIIKHAMTHRQLDRLFSSLYQESEQNEEFIALGQEKGLI